MKTLTSETGDCLDQSANIDLHTDLECAAEPVVWANYSEDPLVEDKVPNLSSYFKNEDDIPYELVVNTCTAIFGSAPSTNRTNGMPSWVATFQVGFTTGIGYTYKKHTDATNFLSQNNRMARLKDGVERAVAKLISLLTYVILRFIAYISKWKGTFARIFTAIRGVLWSRIDLYDLLKYCGTAPGRKRGFVEHLQLSLPLFV